MPNPDDDQQNGQTPPDEVRQAARAVVMKGAPRSIDEANRSVEVVFSTGARAKNYVSGIGTIVEELDMSPKAVRMGILKRGAAPVLDTHRAWGGAGDVLGVVESARIENGQGLAVLRFSSAPDVDRVWAKIKDGTLRNISVGYNVYKYETVMAPDGKAQVYRAVDWEPYEISVVPVPVDQGAGVRGKDTAPRFIAYEDNQEGTMPNEDPNNGGPSNGPVADANRANAPATPPQVVPNQPTSVQPPVQQPVDQLAVIQAERARITGIDGAVAAARALNIPDDRLNAMRNQAISEGWTVDATRSAFFAALTPAGGGGGPVVQPSHGGNNGDDPAIILDAMAEAIAVRAMPGQFKPVNARHQEFLGYRPTDMVLDLLAARGERGLKRDPVWIANRALHTTSDFPLLLSAAANKMLLAAYQPATPTYKSIFARRDFRDFKAHRFLRLGDFPQLLKLRQTGEIQAGTISENEETVALETFARRIRITRQVLVNDDLGAFNDFASMIGRRVADFENYTAFTLLNTNSGEGPTLVQGTANVFTTGRGNKAASGTAIDLTNVSLGRAALMKQTSLDGMPIALGSQMRLLCGPDKELQARQMTVSVAATQQSNANVLAGFISPVVDPLIAGNRWYLFADPAATPIYVYGYLNGAEGPQVTSGPVQGIDGFELQVIFDFGVGALDYRGGWFNTGA